VLAAEVADRIGVAIGRDVPDVVEAEPELAVEEDALQPLEIGIGVAAVAVVRSAAGCSSPISS
jgi:hypothetical protein